MHKIIIIKDGNILKAEIESERGKLHILGGGCPSTIDIEDGILNAIEFGEIYGYEIMIELLKEIENEFK